MCTTQYIQKKRICFKQLAFVDFNCKPYCDILSKMNIIPLQHYQSNDQVSEYVVKIIQIIFVGPPYCYSGSSGNRMLLRHHTCRNGITVNFTKSRMYHKLLLSFKLIFAFALAKRDSSSPMWKTNYIYVHLVPLDVILVGVLIVSYLFLIPLLCSPN